jgi:hypothetical protein
MRADTKEINVIRVTDPMTGSQPRKEPTLKSFRLPSRFAGPPVVSISLITVTTITYGIYQLKLGQPGSCQLSVLSCRRSRWTRYF